MSLVPNNLARRRGTTLAESMIASVLLATSVVGISGALSASYQNQTFADARRAAGTAGRKLMDNVVALPMDPATAGAPSIADYQQASATPAATVSATSPLGTLLVSSTYKLPAFAGSSSSSSSASSSSPPAISVDRRASLNGAASTTGDFAIVTIAVPTQTSSTSTSTVKFKRLVTSVEAAANRAN